MKIFLSILVLMLLYENLFSQYNSPESIACDTVSGRYFISNTSTSKILQRDRQGVVTDLVSSVGGGIHGVTVFNGRVYVCNGNRIKGYDLNTAAEVFNVTLSGSTFLNDLAIDNSGMIYISDFTNRRIYKLNSVTSEYWIYVANTTSIPNGLYVDLPRNRLLVCCWGANAPIKAVNFTDSTIANLITTPYSNCDGISLDKNDNVYVSTWGIQSVVRYDINFLNPPVVVAGSLSNPADIYVNRKTDTLAVPNAGSSTVSFHLLSIPLGLGQNTASANTFELLQNYPNPFNPVTVIRYSLVENRFTTLKIFDALGKVVSTLVNEKQNAGHYSVTFDAVNLPSGVYYCSLESGDYIRSRRVNLVK